MLGHRDAVIGHENHLEPAAGGGVTIDGAGEVVDELDDKLGELIGGRGLAAEEEGAWREGKRGIGAQPVVEHHDVQRVEELALVFVDALDLGVEDRLWVDDLPGLLVQPFGKADFRLVLRGAHGIAESGIAGQRSEPVKF